MHRTAVIVGAGHAGLAMSRSLQQLDIDHVVLERGRIAERWQSERWDSLRLLTPSWMARLPGWSYRGPDPEGFMTMPEVVDYLQSYARSFDAPVLEETAVASVRPIDGGYHLDTTIGPITCDALVVATGACALPDVPALAGALPGHLHQTTPKHYRRPAQLPDGGVLVVGASASGVQIARELRLAGREVVIAAGSHTRIPRRYRGLDIHVWLELMGTLDRPTDTMADLDAARGAPSLQLVGNDDGSPLGLPELQALGVVLAGRASGTRGRHVLFDGSLRASVADADAGQARLLDRIDAWAQAHGLASEVDPAIRPAPTRPVAEPRSIDLRAAGITSVVWATGYRPDFSWLDPGLLAPDGSLPHHGGVVTSGPGLYVLGMPVQRTRKSTFIDGAAADARAVAVHLAARLGASVRPLGDTVPA